MKLIKKLLKALAKVTFWGWNIIFVAVFYCGILPFIGIPLIEATFNGDVPLDFSITFLTLIIIPIASIYIGYKYLRQRSTQLMRFFYGVEAPLVTWCLVRLFLVRELTGASALVLGTLFVTVLAFAIEVIQGYRQDRQVYGWLQAIAHSLMLLMGLYLGLVLLFYAIPVAITAIGWTINFVVNFVSFQWIESFWRDLSHYGILYYFIPLLFVVLFCFSTTVFIGMPSAITGLYINSSRRILLAFGRQHGKKMATGVATVTISIWLILLLIFNQQPQVKAFNLLNKSPQDRQALLASASILRKGLINANLNRYRYLSTNQDNNHIFAMYEDLGFPESVSLFLQHRYNQLLSPFMYKGSRYDVAKSAQLYADFFDTPLQKAERKSVRHALQSTAIVDQAKAGLLNINQKKVWLEKQEVTLNPHGDWADVEIHEVYKNQTTDVEEILYYFSLPESAVITGLWLGETDKKSDRFAFQVSPRGAAQEVYNSQVRRTRPIDPALLEQVGVGQYRLRAFPVPPLVTVREVSIGRPQPRMHLWLTYKVMQQEKGWALPKLAEQRNIYWTRGTKRIRNGDRKWFFANVWLEDFWQTKVKIEPTDRTIDLSNGYQVAVKALTEKNYSLPQNKTYGIILDTSYSMTPHKEEVRTTIEWYKQYLNNNDIDLYVTDAENSVKYIDNLDDFNLDSLAFFGSIDNSQMLQQFQTSKDDKDYDAVLIITDEGSYELSQDSQTIPTMDAPLWMIHLGNKLPRAYNDAILQTIQNTNGGIAQDAAIVMKRLATEEATGVAVVDGYSWAVSTLDAEITAQTGIEPLMARQLVSYLGKNENNLSLAQLDNIHQIAKDNAIVTPYSSMIVLVNDRQKELLKQAEAKADRFDREVESGVEQLAQPNNPFEVSGVPEPELWILLGITAIALFLASQRQKATR